MDAALFGPCHAVTQAKRCPRATPAPSWPGASRSSPLMVPPSTCLVRLAIGARSVSCDADASTDGA